MFCHKSKPKIGIPFDFKHIKSITINPSTGKFVGLPQAWETILRNEVGFYKELPTLETVLKDGHFYNHLPSGSINSDEPVKRKCKPNRKSRDEIYAELSAMCNLRDLTDCYEVVNKLSKDYSGTVYSARNLTSKEMFMIKEIDMGSITYKNTPKEFNLNELKILRHFNEHANLINFIDGFFNQPIERLWIIMEYMPGGALTNVIIETVMNDRQIAAVAREILQGICFLHSKDIFHRDIRSDNILLGLDGTIKVTNFAFCAIIEENCLFNTAVGSPFWMAPEVAAQNNYGVKVDIWSFGITIIEMINGVPPNFGLEPLLAMCLIATKGKPLIEGFDALSQNLKNFIDCCLEIDVARRASAVELISHLFLENCAELQTLIPLIEYTNTIVQSDQP